MKLYKCDKCGKTYDFPVVRRVFIEDSGIGPDRREVFLLVKGFVHKGVLSGNQDDVGYDLCSDCTKSAIRKAGVGVED